MPDSIKSGNGDPRSVTADDFIGKIIFGKYEMGKQLGSGAFGKVYLGRVIPDVEETVAIKVLCKTRIAKSGLMLNVRREIFSMRRINHQNVVKLIDVMASSTNIFLVLELARGGQLFTMISDKGRLTEESARHLFRQLITAMSFCHSRGVYHRDLKPDNLLLDEFGNLKISDFGLSALSPNRFPINNDIIFKTACGTPAYAAPEIIAQRPYFPAKVDVWACGVILFVFLTGYLPFNDQNLINLYRKIYKANYHCPKWMSPDLQNLISKIFDPNPITRISMDGITQDPWFRVGLSDKQLDDIKHHRPDIEGRISKIDVEDEARNLNAFDLISSSFGIDLSSFFVSQQVGKERVVSASSTRDILDKVEEVGKIEGFTVTYRIGKEGRAVAVVQGINGCRLAWVDIYKLNKDLALIELEQGEEAEEEEKQSKFGCFWKNKLLPALKGIRYGCEPKMPISPVSVLTGPSSSMSSLAESEVYEPNS